MFWRAFASCVFYGPMAHAMSRSRSRACGGCGGSGGGSGGGDAGSGGGTGQPSSCSWTI